MLLKKSLMLKNRIFLILSLWESYLIIYKKVMKKYI